MERRDISKYLQAKQNEAAYQRDLESQAHQNSKDRWKWYEAVPPESYKSYDSYFKKLLLAESVQTFHEWATKRHHNDLPNHVLDLMGPGNFIDLNDVDSLLAVTLMDTRNKQEKALEVNKKEVIEMNPDTDDPVNKKIGDIYAGVTWKKISAYSKNKKIKGFDLIVCRPALPFQKKPTPILDVKPNELEDLSFAIHAQLLDRAYKLLTPNQGTLFTQIPNLFKHDHWWHDILPKLENKLLANNISVDYAYAGKGTDNNRPLVLKIIRTPESPDSLPEFEN